MSRDVDLYVRVRRQEGRLYPDDVLAKLPLAPVTHPLRSEWLARTASANRLITYLMRAGRIRILELGCGNGWLANRMAACIDGVVVGLDRESCELHQARRVFGKRRNLGWVSADVFSSPFSESVFEFIVIASAIQYFEDLPRLIVALTPLLTEKGEIHILDSPIYLADDLPGARQRSVYYYERLGFPEMTALYHHHTANSLDAFNPEWLYVPRGGVDEAKDKVPDSPFPWICLRPKGW